MIDRREFLQLAMTGIAAPLGIETVGAATAIKGLSLPEAIETLRALGFRSIEVHTMGPVHARPNAFPGFEFGLVSEADKRKTREALKAFRHVTTHLPYDKLNFFSADDSVASKSIRILEGALSATAFLGAETAVIHLTKPVQQPYDDVVRQFRRWGDIAGQGGFRLAIETGYPDSVRDFVKLIRDIDDEQVGCTIDVGHQAGYAELTARVKPEERSTPAGIKAYNDITHEIIDQLGQRVFHFHVHDIDPVTWKEHKPIGTGFVDYPRLLAKLNCLGYRGVLILEILTADMKSALAGNRRYLERVIRSF
jgi:sugar phosphate isomerase/epimerase